MTASGGGEPYNELERLRAKKAQEEQLRRQAFQKKAARIAAETGQALSMFFSDHRSEKDEIVFDINEFDFSSEELLIYAISMLEQKERNIYHEEI